MVLEVVLAGLALLVLGVARRAAVGARIVVVRLGAVALAAMPMALLVPAINQSLPASSFSLAGTSIDAALRQAAPAAILTIAEPYGPALDTILGQTAFSKRHLFSTQLAVTFELEAEGNLINNLRSKPDSALARAIGIDTIISYRGGSCPGQVLARLPENGGTTICRLDDAARPPYWVPASARLGTPARPTSLLGPADANVAAATDLQSAVPASVLNWDAGGASMIIVAPAAGYVFIDRSWWPAWQVSVDGQAVAVDRVWGGQLIAVPAGRHSIEERFVPWDILIGAALTIGGLVGGGLLAGRPLAGRQRRRWQGVFPRGLRGTQGR